MRRRLLLCGLLLLALLLAGAAQAQEPPGPAGPPATAEQATTGSPAPLAADWTISRVDAPRTFERMGNRSLALDKQDHPHIAYGGEQLYYAWHDGMAWHLETVDPVQGVGQYASLALDAADRPHIAYYDASNKDLKYARYDGAAISDGAAWQIETVESAGAVGAYASLALDAAGRPGISYYTGVLKYAHFDGTAWQIETVDSAGSVGLYSALAMAAGQPRIAYYDAGNGDLKYAAFDGTSWQLETVATTWYSGKYASLALDSAARPHITYCRSADASYCDYLDYAYYDGTAWQIEQVGNEAGWYTSLALDAADHPHISFLDWWDYYPKYAYYDGSSWQIQTVDSGAGGSWYTSLALDSADHPHVSYYQGYVNISASALKYAHNPGTGWQIETVDPGGDAGQYNSLALDAAGRPHISYMAGPPYYDLRYARDDGTAWVTETVDSTGYVGGWTSLALDSGERPHISYYDKSHHALKYARYDGVAWVSTTVDLDLGSYGGYTSLALDAADRPHIVYVDSQNGGIKYARYDGAAWITETVTSSGSYPSLALDAAGRPHISYAANSLRYAYYDGTAWQFQTVDGDGGSWTSLALDAAGRPHIGYYVCDYSLNECFLRHAYNDGTAWAIETVDDTGVEIGSNIPGTISLALDAAGRPHITFSGEVSYRSQLRYARYDGLSWQVTVVESDLGYEFQDSLALDAAGLPHVSYYDWLWGDLKYAEIGACIPITDVVVTGPSLLSAGHTGLYTATFAPPTATLPLWAWDNGTTEPTAVYSWTLPGAYTVAVTATSACAEVRATWPVSVYCQPVEEVTVRGPQQVPLQYGATYRASAAPITASLPLAWQWDNGTAGPTAVYSWTVPGNYTLAVTATNLCGEIGGTYAITAYCQPAVSTDFTWQPAFPLVQQPVSFAARQRAEENGWYTATVAGMGGDGSLALDAAGHPHISYYDSTNADLRYAYHDGSAWHTTTVDSGGTVGWDSSLALDSGGRPHISYYDYTNSQVKYAFYDGSTWQLSVVENINYVVQTSLALDSAGRPHISYGTFIFMGGILRYAWYDGSTWHTETLESGLGNRFPALALDAADRPHIAYNGENNALRYAYYDGSAWTLVTVTGSTSAYLDLALDAAGHPQIAFSEYPGQQLKYAHNDGNGWTIETVTGGSGTNLSLALDGEGHPHLSYGNGALQYAAFDGSAWYTETVDDGIGVGTGTCIALDSQDWAYISYNGAHPDLRYARWIGPTTPPITYTWNLGDGSTAAGTVVSYTYNLTGTYTVVLTGTNCGGVDTVVTHTVTVVPPCDPVHDVIVSWTPPTPTALFPLTLTAAAGGTPPVSFAWDLGDGTRGTGAVVTHTYGTAGVYTVVLTASNCTTATATVVHTLTVAPCQPVVDADFAWVPLTPTAGQPVALTGWASGTLPIAYAWDLGDGRLAEGAVVSHVYYLPGSYTVTLTTTNCAGDTSTAVRTLGVAAGCEPVHVANFAWSPPTPTAEVGITFTAWADAGGWITETLSRGGQRAWYGAMALDALGRPHVVYGNQTIGTMEYARWDGTTWVVVPMPFTYYSSLSLDVDAAGRPHVSYYDPSDMQLKYAYLGDSGWVVQTVDGDVGYYGTQSSLKLDAAGRPHISYNKTAPMYDLRYAYYDGTAWVTMTVDSGGDGSSLDLDSRGRPHIAYAVAGEVRYASYNGTTWQIESVGDSGAYAWSVSLDLDSLDRPQINYFDTNNNRVRWAERREAGWQIETVDEALYVAGNTVLAADAGNEPLVGYVDSLSATLRYAWRGRGGWQVAVVDPLGAGQTGPVGMALDGIGRPHIAYSGGSDDVRYARLEPLPPTPPISYTWSLGDGTVAAGTIVRHTYGQPDSYTVTLTATNCIGETRVRVHRVEVAPCQEVRGADFSWNPRAPATGWPVTFVGNTWGQGNQWTSVHPGYSGRYNALALDPAGQPRIASGFNYGYGGDLWYSWTEGQYWTDLVMAEGCGAFVSLALDTAGAAHFSCYDGTLKHVYFDGFSRQIETVDNEGDVGLYTSLALDTAGHPSIAYYDATNGDLKYARYDGTAWTIETVDSAGDVGRHTSLALDAVGHPHVSYLDETNGTLKHAWYDGTTWRSEVVDAVGTGSTDTSLDLDAAGHPHIGYYDALDQDLKYARYDGSAWQVEMVDGTGDVGTGTSLALDAGGRPHISYYDRTDSSLRYADSDGSSWDIERVAYTPGQEGNTSLRLDASGRPRLSYYDSLSWELRYAWAEPLSTLPASYTWDLGDGSLASGGAISHTYATSGTFTVLMTATNCAAGMVTATHTITVSVLPCTPVTEAFFAWTPLTPTTGQAVTFTAGVNGGGWYSETMESAGGGRSPSLALDSDGGVHVAYYNLYSGTLQYASRRGQDWQIETVDSGLGSYGGFSSLALDAAGRPHISYMDGTLHALKYAYYDGSDWHVEIVDQDDNLGIAYNSLALDAAGRPHIGYINWSNDKLMHAYNDGSSWQIEWVASGSLGASLALDAAGQPCISYWNGALFYARYNGTTWQVEMVDGYSSRYPALALDLFGRPHISYSAAGNLRYAWYDGSAWITETLDSAGLLSSLALDAAGRPHISYAASSPGPLKYAYYDGTAWQSETVDAQADDNGYSSLALDAAGRPHISYGGHTDAESRYAVLQAPPTTPVSYTWDLGDGTMAAGEVLAHRYNLPGAYTVVLTATNCGPEPATAVHTVTVSCEPVHNAGFAWQPFTPTAGLPVTFTAAASGTAPISYTWNLGDGATAAGDTITHSYGFPGVYQVVLTAANCATATAQVTHTLAVTVPPCAGAQIFTVTTAISRCTVTFGAELAGTPPFTYLWTFASGTSTVTNPTIDFGGTGIYTGTLEVWNCGGEGHAVRAFAVAVECAPPTWKLYLPLILRAHPVSLKH